MVVVPVILVSERDTQYASLRPFITGQWSSYLHIQLIGYYLLI